MSQQLIPKLRFSGFIGEWEIKKLGDLAKIFDGTHQTPNYVKSGVPFYSVEQVTSNNFTDTKFIAEEVYDHEIKRIVIERGDIIMTRIGDIGTVKYVDWDVKASFYVSLALIKKSGQYSSKFLAQYIKTSNFQHELWNRTIHVAFPIKINLGEIDNCIVRIPRQDEQEKIAGFLTLVDERITMIDKRVKLLKQYKKSIMQKVFSQQIRFKDETGKDYPAWQHITLDDVLTFARNGLSIEQNTRNLGRKVTRIETISTGSVNPMKTGYIDTDLDISEYKLKVGDLLFSNINSPSQIGRTVYVDREYDIYHGMNLLCLRVDNENSPLYVYYLLTSHKYKQYFEAICNKAVNQASINQTDLKKTKIVMPSKEEQCKVADFLASLDDKIKLTEEQLVQAKTFKKSLLQRMFV